MLDGAGKPSFRTLEDAIEPFAGLSDSLQVAAGIGPRVGSFPELPKFLNLEMCLSSFRDSNCGLGHTP